MWRFFIFNQFLISLTSSLKNEKKILSLPPGSSNSKRNIFSFKDGLMLQYIPNTSICY